MAEYSELVEILPRVTEPVTLLEARTGFAYVTEPNPAFVMPELRRAAEGYAALRKAPLWKKIGAPACRWIAELRHRRRVF